jgi:uncharacterized membrane protein
MVMTSQQVVVGPLPSPEVLAHYDIALPGTAERIVRMAEREQEFRHTHAAQKLANERSGDRAAGFLYLFGQASGLLITLMGLFFGYRLIALGRDLSGYATVLTTLGTLAGVFVWGRRRQPAAQLKRQPAAA